MTRYRCVAARKAEGFPVARACAAAGVSTSAFYAWACKPDGPTAAELDEAYLVNQIIDIHAEWNGVYGSPRMTAELRRRGWQVNHKRIERLMRINGIVGHRPRKRRSLTKQDADTPPLPDLVARRFNPDRPDHSWVGDITYVPTDEGWLYLAGVLDLGSRRLIGYAMGEAHDAQLAQDALEEAVVTRGLSAMDGTIFHSDRGSEYTSQLFRAACQRLGLRQSAGRTGACLDNAVAEAFFASLKVELVDRVRFASRAEARTAVFAWIVRYNARRLHSTLGYLPPMEWEDRHHNLAPSPLAA